MTSVVRKDYYGIVWNRAYGNMWCREIAFNNGQPIVYDVPTDPKDPKSQRIFVKGVKSYALRHADDITWN